MDHTFEKLVNINMFVFTVNVNGFCAAVAVRVCVRGEEDVLQTEMWHVLAAL